MPNHDDLVLIKNERELYLSMPDRWSRCLAICCHPPGRLLAVMTPRNIIEVSPLTLLQNQAVHPSEPQTKVETSLRVCRLVMGHLVG